MRTLLVTPTYNEADNLPLLVAALREAGLGDKNKLPGLNLLVVDDNSPDGTGKLADELAAEQPDVIHVMHRPAKSGLGRAYVDGYSWALERGYEAVAQMDADLSHDPHDVPKLIAAAEAGADVAIGSRYLNGISVINWPLRRILLSLGANEYVRRVMGLSIHDATSGFRVYKAQALEAMQIATIRSSGYSFQVEMTYRAYLCGCKIEEVPIVFTERRAGHSKMSRGVILESAKMPWRLRFRRRALQRTLGKCRPHEDKDENTG